jgi:hypothetical protein
LPKGIKHGISTDVEHAFAEFYGGVKERIILFSAETGISANWVAERLATLLLPERERVLHHMSVMRIETARDSRAVEPLALAVNAHSSETSSPVVGSSRQDATGKTLTPQQQYWANKTPAERVAEFKRRQRKWKPDAKAKWKGTKPSKKPHYKAEKQKIYAARNIAKKAGLPLPPLPFQKASQGD